MTREDIARIVLALPETETGTTHGLPSFKAAGKFLTRIRAEDDSVVVYVDSLDHREMLIEAEPQTFHVTDHYRNYPIVLARIGTVDPVWLASAIRKRWRHLVPKRVSRVFDTLQSGAADA